MIYPLEAWLIAHQANAPHFPQYSCAPIMSDKRRRELARVDRLAEVRELARQFRERKK